MDNYETVIVELVVYMNNEDYVHKFKSVEEIVEEELELIESDSGIYLERFISEDEIIINDEEN
tara:strand:- start:2158 stop:2346 length:189 start_codon:yes stop_codon:yes gene_type:complete